MDLALRLACGIVLGFLVSSAGADTVSIEVPRTPGVENSATLAGDLRIPASAAARLPAVVVLHTAGGVDGRSASIIEKLSQAGFATLEVQMFARGGAIPFKDSLPYAYASLAFLAKQPKIDPDRVAVLGFSYGGLLAILSASADQTRAYTAGTHRFAAHVALYPICWIHAALTTGAKDLGSDHTNRFLRGISEADYQRTTGAPVLLLAGDKDQYDDAESCTQFVNQLPSDVRSSYAVITYPGASHGWNALEDRVINDPAAYKGRGGRVSQVANKEIAANSATDVLMFLKVRLAKP